MNHCMKSHFQCGHIKGQARVDAVAQAVQAHRKPLREKLETHSTAELKPLLLQVGK